MSAPAAFTVNVPFEYDALPARPTAPTSLAPQGAGSVDGVGVGSGVGVGVGSGGGGTGVGPGVGPGGGGV